MDPNQDTVRSLATLLVEDENEDKTSISPPRNGSATNGIKPRFTTQTSNTSHTSVSSGQVSDIDPNDSVFGDVPLEDAPTRFQLTRIHKDSLTHETRIPDLAKPSAFKRQGSFRSQLSVLSQPAEPPPKQELTLKTFVAILFIIIVTGVSLVLHFAHAKEYQAEVGKKIIVHEDTRKIQYQNTQHKDILHGDFGLNIPKGMLPHDCSVDKTRKSHLCLRWKEYAEVNIDYWEQGLSKCFDASWQAFSKGLPLKDCFDLDLSRSRWYGGWVDGQQSWPLSNRSLPLQPYVTGDMYVDDTFGPVLERYWLSSKGVSIFSTDLNTPLHVSWNAEDPGKNKTADGQLCLVSGHTHPIYTLPKHTDVWLNYTVCVSSNILDVHHLSLKRIADVRNISDAFTPDLMLFDKPVWSASGVLHTNFSSSSLEALQQRLTKLNLPVGVLMLGNEWQDNRGDFKFNLGNASETFKNLQQQFNCTLCLSMDPYVSVHSKYFAEIASKNLLVKDGSEQVPGLTKLVDYLPYNREDLAGVLDLTHPDVVHWYQDQINKLKTKSGVSLINFEGGVATSLPFSAKLSGNRTNRNLFSYDYGTVAWENSKPAMVDSATHLQTHPVIVRLQITDLENVIPALLTMGVLGYPYVLTELHDPLQSKELYIRSIQLSAFLPIMHINTPPDEFGADVVRIVRKMINQHQALVHPRVVHLSQGAQAIDPIIRPLWWIAPNDSTAADINTEFVIGDDLIVAPILKAGVYKRNVYLPAGKWYSKERTQYTGPSWLWDYAIPLSDFAYFTNH